MGHFGGGEMVGLVESATAILSASQRRLEAVANNVANATTPGFRRQLSFSEFAAGAEGTASASPLLRSVADSTPGRLTETGHRLDMAIAGEGFFRLRAGEAFLYSRQGQFRLAEDGRVVDQSGHTLQQAGGGDLVLDRSAVELLADGTVLDDGRPVGRVGVFLAAEGAAVEPLGGSLFAVADAQEAAEPELRQGMVEASNVALGDEMVAMMAALRQAESGARLIQLYDELIGRAVTTFGQAGR